jgi:hypothetical protein
MAVCSIHREVGKHIRRIIRDRQAIVAGVYFLEECDFLLFAVFEYPKVGLAQSMNVLSILAGYDSRHFNQRSLGLEDSWDGFLVCAGSRR